MITVTLKSMRDDLRAIVNEMGEDYRYQKPASEMVCLYWHKRNGSFDPGCIFGHWFARHGWTQEQLEEIGVTNTGMNIRDALNVLRDQGMIEMPDHRHLLTDYALEVQGAQDVRDPAGMSARYTWGEALQKGDDFLSYRLSAEGLREVAPDLFPEPSTEG
jgi:hypothetical protein